jgi:hypothetical protein
MTLINKKQIVKDVLMYDMRARDDDPYLYLAVAKKLRIDHL